MQGTTLGPYRIESELGSGGMGTVWLATKGGERVALKIVHPHLLATPGFFKRFLREGEIGRRIRHENVVATLDADAIEQGGRTLHFLAMEYVEGQTLRELLHELGRVPEELCRHIGRETANGLAAIHAAGVVHRDVKPENVIITKSHVVKVMDLGVARLADEALRLSQTGAFVGSIHYAAPEQFRGPAPRSREGAAHSAEGVDAVDGRADLHALGVILYELSTAQHPYAADDFHSAMRRVLDEKPRRPAEINPQLSPFFEELVLQLLAKRRDDRFASASEVARVLDEGERSAWWKSRAKAIRVETKRPLRRIRIPRETALHGRGAELSRLRGVYDRARAGEGQVVLVEGEAGIGKSRLVDEFVGLLQREGEDVNFLYGSYPPGGAATASGAFSTAYREQFGEADLDETLKSYLAVTPVLVPAFAALLRGEPAPTGIEPLTKDSLQTVFVHATRGLAAERTTIVLIDDLHFAPEEGRALFAALAMAVPGHRILLVGTARPGLDEKWTSSLDRTGAARIALPRLGAKDLVRLLADTLRSEHLATELSGRIALKSDGNPFFVFEILRVLREGLFITRTADGAWTTTRVIGDIQIPSSILELVQARVADLDDAERNLLDVAACVGFEFDPALVGSVVGMSRIPALQAFGRIEKKHRLVRSAGRNYVFDHHQVAEALYGGLNAQLREAYHAAVAETLEAQHGAAATDPSTLDGALCANLAGHFLDAARGPQGLRYLDAALTHLEKGCLNDAAVRLAERALAVPGLLTGTARAAALLRLCASGGPLDRLGRRARQSEAAHEAARLADESGDDSLRARAAAALGTVFDRTSRQRDAESAFRRQLDLAQALGDRKTEAAATVSLGCALMAQGNAAGAREHLERALAISRGTGNREGEAVATGNLGRIFYAQGRLEEARDHYTRARAISRETGDRQAEASSAGNLGAVFHTLGHLAEAQEHHERHLALSREIGNRMGEATATGNLGNVLMPFGRLVEAREHYERYLALSREIAYRKGEAIALVNLGPAWLALGDRFRARESLEQSLVVCREIGAQYPEGYALASLGLVADEEDDVAAAERFMEESLALRRRIGHGDGVAESLTALGDLRRRTHDFAAARAALDESVSLSRQQGRKVQVALALAILACLPGGNAAAATSALAETAASGRSARVFLLLWRATGDAAHLAEGKRLLDEALAKVPPEHHAAMLANVRVNREITEAWRERGDV